jgi:hypothetical protein
MATAADTFVDTNGTALQSHTPTGNTGAAFTWSRHPTRNNDILVDDNRVYCSVNNQRHIYITDITPPSAEYDVTVDTFGVTNATSEIGPSGRYDPTAETGYYAARRYSLADVQLSKAVTGTNTVLGTWSLAIPASGEVLSTKLEIRTAAKKVYVDGVERISSTDDAITGTGRPGIRGFDDATTTAGLHAEGWNYDDLAAGGGAYTPRLGLLGVGD